MRYFGNDSDGFTMTDLLSLIIVLTTVSLVFIGVFYTEYTESIKVALRYLKIPFWTVLGSYFGIGVIVHSIPFASKSYRKVKTMLKRDDK
jgi:hypothetical protein